MTILATREKIVDYQFKTKPYAHQEKGFLLCRDKDSYALLLEQGCGKSKIAIDKAAYQYCEGKIDAILIVAPNGVHRNWVTNEIPTHMPEYIKYDMLSWNKSTKFKAQFDSFLIYKSLIIFAINIDALATDAGKHYIRRFLEFRKTLFILDESSRIKTPSAARTKAAINFGKLAKERLILTGTPVTQSPFDIYAQFKFLDQEILGNQTYTAFKHEYGIFNKKLNHTTGYPYEELVQYRQLDKLQAIIAPYSFRVTKEECLDLPDKIYQRYTVELDATQRRHYHELEEELYTIIGKEEISTPVVLTQLLRLHQITGGFLTRKEENAALPVSENNPKLELLLELLEDINGKVIIWARFAAEITAIVKAIRARFGWHSTTEYWGNVSQQDRENAVYNFQHLDNTRFFIGNARAGGIGLTLTTASTMIYYSNDFSLETRLQSEDRAHRIGQKKNVTYIDIEAIDTIDSKIIEALRNKKNIADLITGDKIKSWL